MPWSDTGSLLAVAAVALVVSPPMLALQDAAAPLCRLAGAECPDPIVNLQTAVAVTDRGIWLSKDDAPPVSDAAEGSIEFGDPDAPVARSAMARAHWRYDATVEEAAPDALRAGLYRVDLLVDGVSVGTLYMAQRDPDPGAVERARFQWDVGPEIRDGPTSFVIRISAA